MRRKTSVRGVKQIGPGRYEVRVTFIDPKTGKERNRVREIEASSVTEAARKRLELKAQEIAAREPRERQRLRLGDAAISWLDSRASGLKASTLAQYGAQMDAWIATIGADVFLDRIEPEDVVIARQRWVDEGLSVDTVNGRLRCLRTFAKEHRAGHIVENVHILARPPGKKKPRSLTEPELRRLLRVGLAQWRAFLKARTRKNRHPQRHVGAWWPLLSMSLWTGMRFGEATALRWSDYDRSKKTIEVARAQWHGIEDAPKTEAGNRVIAVSAPLAAVLEQHRRRLMLTQKHAARGLMFPSPRTGELVNNTGLRKAMLKLCEEAKIGSARKSRTSERWWLDGRPVLHCLRHSLNNIIRQVADEHVRQDMLGHADFETGQIYTSVQLREQRAAIAKVVGRIGRR